jgi:hypothetical protein
MARVFISYRRNDTQWVAGRLYDRLAEVIGSDNVFFDVSNIAPGEDFVSRIREFVARCDVLLAIIGPSWASSADRTGNPRLQSPRDLVRIEIAAALQRNIRVIPILVDGAVMPEEDLLPTDLAALATRNAHSISFPHFHSDTDSFVRVLRKLLEEPPNTAEARRPPAGEVKPSEVISNTVADRLPFTISLTSVGGVASPLIPKGATLPAQASEVFSTAADNQTSVEVSLVLGERPLSADNFPIGKFQLPNIPAAPRGIPQIKVTANVDSSLILTVSAEDMAVNHKEVLDAIDLTRLNVPPEILSGGQMPEVASSERDSPVNSAELFKQFGSDKGNPFSDFFQTFFGESPLPDVSLAVTLTPAEAVSGVSRRFELPNGKQITVRIPAGIQPDQRLRVRGEGNPKKGGGFGDVYIRVRVSQPH